VARALLIFNPVAARTDPEVVAVVSRVFTKEGWDLDVAGTNTPGHAEDLARMGVDAGVDLIAVYGGDGTTMQAMRGIVGSEIPVGLIPGGTGNLLAGNLKLPRDPKKAAKIAMRGTPRRIDLGQMECRGAATYFAVAAGAGVDAELMAVTTGAAKRRWGMGAYVARAWDLLVRRLKVVHHRITVDGETFEADAATVLVANCGLIIPPLVRLKQDILFDDGLFDVVVLNAKNVAEGVDVVFRIITGLGHGGERVLFMRGKSVTVETETPRPVQLDGEPCGDTPFTAEIVPSAVSVVVPQ